MFKMKESVIVIGAGLSGLTAAQEILKAQLQTSVIVLEAMSEPGGRTKSKKINGAYFDLGGQWIGSSQKFINDLALRAKSKTFLQQHQGKRVMQIGKQISIFNTDTPRNFGFFGTLELRYTIWRIQKMSKTVPLQNPQDCPNSVQWDSQTAYSWVRDNTKNEKIKAYLLVMIISICGCQPNEISFLFFLWYVNHNSGFDKLNNISGGLQQSKFVKGSQSLSFFLVEEIIKRGGQIKYNNFVNYVKQDSEGVIIRTRQGEQYRASYLVMANPPIAIKTIQFQPQLSRERRFMRDRYIMGAFSKMIILYDKQYWKEKGFSGEIISDCQESLIMQAYDQSRPKDNGDIQPAILIFFAGLVDEKQNKTEFTLVKKNVLQKLAEYFQSQQMLNPISTEVKIWNFQESIQGGPCAFTPPGVLTRMGDIRKPEGRIHWAGTETARISQGYMDGAIQSGVRVSKQIIQRLKGIENMENLQEQKSKLIKSAHKQISWWKRIMLW